MPRLLENSSQGSAPLSFRKSTNSVEVSLRDTIVVKSRATMVYFVRTKAIGHYLDLIASNTTTTPSRGHFHIASVNGDTSATQNHVLSNGPDKEAGEPTNFDFVLSLFALPHFARASISHCSKAKIDWVES